MTATTTPATAAETSYAIELVAITKRYGETVALSDVNLDIERGEFLVLLGPSGCGKSTLLKIIAGLEDATEGEIYIEGKLANYVRPKERDVSMVFQNYALYPHMTIGTNLGFPLRMRGVRKEEVAREVASVAALLELTDQLAKYPEQLSGGQRQRVALGRAIIRKPAAFLMDEPLSNLDALLRVQMRSELLKLHRRVGRTTVYVTHDQVEAMTMANRIVVLRSGVVQQVGTTHEVYARPANTFVATFVGSPQMNLFAGHVDRSAGGARFVGQLSVPLGAGVPDGEIATLGIRPEEITPVGPSEPDAIPARIELVEAIGPENFLNCVLGDGLTAIVRVPGKMRVAEGETLHLRFPSEALNFFDADGGRAEA